MLRRLRAILPAGVAYLVAAPLAAQSTPRPPSDAAVRRAVATITEAGMHRRIAALSDDSMRGRDTPSPELDQAAAYVAAEFRRLGLRPGGDHGSYIQRFRVRRAAFDSTSFVEARVRGVARRWSLGRDVAYDDGALPQRPVTGPAVLLTGLPSDTVHPFGGVDVRGAVVVDAFTWDRLADDLTPMYAAVRRAQGAGAIGWIALVSGVPASRMARWTSSNRHEHAGPVSVGPESAFRIPIVVAGDTSATQLLRAAGENPAAIFAPGSRGVRPLRGVSMTIALRRRVLAEFTAPNVIGILEGSDPRLHGEHVAISAHTDHVGVGQPVMGDSIFNGADDNASGTASAMALARAFASLNPRPRRSMEFVVVSGEEKGLWGSTHYASHPPVPLAQTVADLNMDMISRNAPNSISVIGQEHSSLGETARRGAGEHPELNIRVASDMWPGERFFFQSDQINFARGGVPSIFFFAGPHPDYHRVTDTVDRADVGKAMRVTRLVFYVGLDVANAARRPQWNPESRRQIVEAGN